MTKTCSECWPADCNIACYQKEPQRVKCECCGDMTNDLGQQPQLCIACRHLNDMQEFLPQAIDSVASVPDKHLVAYKKMLEKLLRAIRKEAKDRGLA